MSVNNGVKVDVRAQGEIVCCCLHWELAWRGGVLMAESDTIFGVGSVGGLLWNLPALEEGGFSLWGAPLCKEVAWC